MPHPGARSFFSGGAVEILLLGVVAILLMVLGVFVFLGARQTAAQRERRRRLMVNRTGRMGDATISDVRDSVLYYSYVVRGVAYTTSQDASDFKDLLPSETATLIGPTAMKYSPKNPANSILICEEWSGLRPAAPQVHEIQAKESSHT